MCLLYIWPYSMIIDLYTGHSAAINRCQPQRGKYKMQMQNYKSVKYFISEIIWNWLVYNCKFKCKNKSNGRELKKGTTFLLACKMQHCNAAEMNTKNK